MAQETRTDDGGVEVRPSVEPAERRKRGKAARKRVSRSMQGEFTPAADRPDPVALLEAQAKRRVQKLLPIRYGRMSDSPFRFYRGAAAVMAWDLGNAPSTKLKVQACGDAHITNFGIFATPERRLIFDLNDFDETLPAPFEWDVKRLVTSVIIAGRGNSFTDDENRAAAHAAVGEYREAMRAFSEESTLSVWYESLAVDDLLDEMNKSDRKRAEKGLRKIGKRTSIGSLDKLTVVEDGRRILKEKPHLIERVPAEELDGELRRAFDGYMRSLPPEVRALSDRYSLGDMAFKVVGVGSVGTRAWIVYLDGQGPGDDPLFLQIKEADRSVLEPYAGASRLRNQGRRVVSGQHIMQAASDVFLGWTNADGTDYYVRQLRDWKGSPAPEEWDARQLANFSRGCGWTLARAHARSLDPALIAGYLGKSDKLDRAIMRFAEAYADQNDADYARLLAAIDAGEIEAMKGV
jgi:uncharacterized protein (DUF2252 family)